MTNILQRVADAAAELIDPNRDIDERFEAAVAAFEARIDAARAAYETAQGKVAAGRKLQHEAGLRLQALTQNAPTIETGDYEAVATWAAELARAREADRAIDDLILRAQASAELARRNLQGVGQVAYEDTLGSLTAELLSERARWGESAPADPFSPDRPRFARRFEAIAATLRQIERFKANVGLAR